MFFDNQDELDNKIIPVYEKIRKSISIETDESPIEGSEEKSKEDSEENNPH